MDFIRGVVMRKILLLMGLATISFSSSIYTDGGRYEFSQISDMRRDQYLVDTQTGKSLDTYFF